MLRVNRSAIDDIIYDITPGVGKTDDAMERVGYEFENGTATHILYAIPTRKTTIEIERDMIAKREKAGGDYAIMRYQVRNAENCERYGWVARAEKIGQDPHRVVCLKCGRFQKTKNKPKCGYYKQLDMFTEHEQVVMVCTHAAVGVIKPRIGVSLTICDESPTGAMVKVEDVAKKTEITPKMEILDIAIMGKTLRQCQLWRKIQVGCAEAEKWVIGEAPPPMMSKLADKPMPFLQIPLGPDAEMLTEAAGDSGWAAHVAAREAYAALDHAYKCQLAQDEVDRHNESVDKENERKIPEYEKRLRRWDRQRLKYEQFERARVKLEMGLATREEIEAAMKPFPEKKPRFRPCPKKEYPDGPAYKAPKLDRAKWNERWEGWAEVKDSMYREWGVTADDLIEAEVIFGAIEADYLDGDEAILMQTTRMEVDFMRRIIRGEYGGHAYRQITLEVRKSENRWQWRPKSENKILINTRWPRGGRLIICDGTANIKELQSLFNCQFRRLQARVAPVEPNLVHIKQNYGNRVARSLATCKDREEARGAVKEDLRDLFSRLRSEDKRVLIYTHNVLAEARDIGILDLARNLDPSREYAVEHFHGGRGTNEYSDWDAVVMLGTPYLTPIEGAAISRAIFGYVDYDWIASKGMEEMTQCAMRVRPVHGPKSVIVMGLTFPVAALGQPRVIDRQRQGGAAADAVEALTVLAGHHGCLTRPMAESAGAFDAGDKEKIDAWHARMGQWPPTWPAGEWSRTAGAVAAKTGQPLVRRRRKGKGRPAVCCGSLDSLKKWIEARGEAWIEREWETEGARTIIEPHRMPRRGILPKGSGPSLSRVKAA
jgi:hypothetical protein